MQLSRVAPFSLLPRVTSVFPRALPIPTCPRMASSTQRRGAAGLANSDSRMRRFLVGIETSCDETAASVVDSERNVLSSVVYSQWAQQVEYRGVYPLAAARAHEDCIEQVLERALSEAEGKGTGFRRAEVDAVAITAGPGLGPCLYVGMEVAKRLSSEWGKPLVAVNHIEAHAMVARLTRPDVEFPFLALIVSGGHTELWLARAVGDYNIIGDTLDDAIGEAFDKVARLLQIPQHLEKEEAGGAAVERLASEGLASRFALTVPMMNSSLDNCNFSFSGLKSNVRRLLQNERQRRSQISADAPLEPQTVRDVCASFQDIAIRHLEQRLVKAFSFLASTKSSTTDVLTSLGHRLSQPSMLPSLIGVKHLVVGGGVASNNVIRTRISHLSAAFGIETVFPPRNHCTDNAIMIAWTGWEKFSLGIYDSSDIVYQPQWPVGPKLKCSIDPLVFKAFNHHFNQLIVKPSRENK